MDLLTNQKDYLDCLYRYRNSSIPIEETDDGKSYSQCAKYDVDYGVWEASFWAGNATNETIECDEGWVHDSYEYQRTIISDFDLVCDQKTAADLAQSIYFAGVLFGSFVMGSLSDIIGRRVSLILTVSLVIIFQIAASFAPSFWSYCTFRFFVGAFNIGGFLLAFVIVTELVGPSKRVYTGIIIQLFYAVGAMLLTLFGYLIRNWEVLQLTIMALFVVCYFTFPFVPESARWLVVKSKYDKAEKIINKMAKGNKATDKLPADYMSKVKKWNDAQTPEESNVRNPSFIDLFRTPNLRTTTVNLMYNWAVCSMVYYGLSLSTSDLGGNIYISFFISGAVEVPAYLLCIPAIESPLGRRYSTSAFQLLAGVACLITIVIPIGPWKTTVAMIGKFGVSASFALVYIYAAEVFPTPLRSVGVGICSTSSRIGGILSPLILLLDEVWEPLPLIIFGLSAILGGSLVLLLPETRGKDLPETIEEGELFNSRKSTKSKEDVEKEAVHKTENGNYLNPGFEKEDEI
ncbi:putative organic cation transporter protein-like [Apostichopus japonicus]|uniref:Putative organic cation transporter protein-like n=1 Tax=Stichopus japonicus TaxID=307972 RepID=A0A2G8L370_STIJA|nr:putative organic cation transporter protein-like [Apostichopus japonicus]